MSCRRCGEQEDFVDGNEGEELCKHCLDHCCENCFSELETEKDYERHMCYKCYEEDFFQYMEFSPIEKIKKSSPKCFTFSDEDIEQYEKEYCLEHCCELEIEKDNEIKICYKCYEEEQKKNQSPVIEPVRRNSFTGNPLNNSPQYFTFSDEDIVEFEFEQKYIQKMNKKLQEKKKKKKKSFFSRCLPFF